MQQTVSLLTGQRVTSTLPVTASMVEAFTEFSGDRNPLHVDAEAARTLGMPRRVAHGAILLAEVSRIIGMEMPGHGALWLSSQFDFRKPVFVGDTVQLEVQVEHHSPALGVVVLAIRVVNARDETVLEGSANVKLLEGVMPLAYTPLEKQTVLVTGGTRGLGAEISRFLAERGATVIAAFRTDEEAATALKDDLTSEAASRLHTVRCDIQDEAQVDALFARLAEEGRTLDSVVHAASPAISDVPFTELSWDHFDPFLKTYVKGGLLLAQAAAKQFEGVEAGRFVLIGSEAVTSPRRGWLHYVTAKSAYVGLVRGLAAELAEAGATANLVSPASSTLPTCWETT